MARHDLAQDPGLSDRNSAEGLPWSGTVPSGEMVSPDDGSVNPGDVAGAGIHDALELRDFYDAAALASLPRLSSPLRHPLRFVGGCWSRLVALISIVLLLALVAAIPIANFIALGYLLDAEGNVARTRRLRSGFPLNGPASRLGVIVLGVWMWLWPIRLFSTLSINAALVAPTGTAATVLPVVTRILAVLIGVHLCLAIARGGRLSCFVRPIRNATWFKRQVSEAGYWVRADRHVRDFVRMFRLRHHFLLGVQGFLGAFAWLLVPTAMLAATRSSEGGPLLFTLAGGLLMVPILSWVPFLQARFAAEQRLSAFRELSTIRSLFHRAPIAWTVALLATLILTLPLFLAKIRLPPDDAMWLITIIFIATIYPARLITGWAYARAVLRESDPWWGWVWLCRAITVPILVGYVVILFFTQFIDEQGKIALFEHHAFLLPVPF